MSELQGNLIEEFRDAEYAQVYVNSHVVDKLAAQIYHTRQARGLTQAQLGTLSGLAQERISKIESGDFSSLTMATLCKFAAALDVALSVEFHPFSHAIHDVCNVSLKSLKLAGRDASLDEMKASYAAIQENYSSHPIFIPRRSASASVNPSDVESGEISSGTVVTI